MVSAEEIIDDNTDEEDIDVEEMSSNEDSHETAVISSGESMHTFCWKLFISMFRF